VTCVIGGAPGARRRLDRLLRTPAQLDCVALGVIGFA
jgi:hypothetical protein